MSAQASYAFVPARMNADKAAFYLGVSRAKFLRRVASGEYPPPVYDGGNTLWITEDLDGYVQRSHSAQTNRGKPLSVEDQILGR